MHVSPECDVSCWGKDSVPFGSCWNKNVVGMYAWVVNDPMCSRMSAKLSEVFGRCSDVFDGYFFSPICVFRWFRHDVGSVECRGVWELGKGVVVRFGKIG